jgi:competence protein ComFC
MTLAGLNQPPAYKLYHLLWEALDWLFPPLCGGCGKVGARWCQSCQDAAPRILNPFCQRCGTLLREGDECIDCRNQPPAYTALRAFYLFDEEPRRALHRLKYNQDIGLGEALAQPMAALLAQLNWPVDLVTCVPLNKVRQAERGYNQSMLLARPLALIHQLPFSPRCLQRIRNTASQVTMTAVERRANLLGAFRADPALVKGKTILVVDDIATTGSTLQACALALQDAGARAVYGLTAARANYVSQAV